MFPKTKVKRVPQSGAGVVKGDVEFGGILIQSKACGKDLRISEADLIKARTDAIGRGKSPAVMCELDSGKKYWVIEDAQMMDWWGYCHA